MKIETKEAFGAFVKEIQAEDNYRNPFAFALCRVQRSQLDPNKILDATSLFINWHLDEKPNYGSAALFLKLAGALEETNLHSISELVLDIDADFIQTAYDAYTPYHDEAVGAEHLNAQAIMGLVGANKPWEQGKNSTVSLPELKAVDPSDFQLVFLFEDTAIESTTAAWLKLELISRLKVKPHGVNLDGLFAHLPTVAWAGSKAHDEDYLRLYEMLLKINDEYPVITSWDKFPALAHKLPLELSVRIADCSRVRAGAYVGEGTTVMHEGFINFNAGMEGPGMNEGRISAGVLVGAGSDLGGSSSTMGILSGGNKLVISIGKECLLGANAGTGIPLGNGNTIEAGFYLTAGTKLRILCKDLPSLVQANPEIDFPTANEGALYITMKAVDLTGCNNVLFRRDSQDGAAEARFSEDQIKLNADLHGDAVKSDEVEG